MDGDPGLVSDHLLRAQRQRDASSPGRAYASSSELVCSDCAPPSTAAMACECRPHHVIVRLLPGKRAARRLGMESQLQTALVSRAEAVAHKLSPERSRRTVLRDLFEEIVVRVEKEAQARREVVDCQPALERPFHVLDAVAQRKRQFLHGRGTRFPDVISADGNGVEARQCRVPNSIVSVTRRMEGAAGRCTLSARCTLSECRSAGCPRGARQATPCCSATARYMAHSTAAGELMVIDT